MPAAQAETKGHAEGDPAGGLFALAHEAATAAEALLADATLEVRARVTADGRTSGRLLDREQRAATVGDCLLDDTLEQIRDEMRRFADSEVMPHAHGWHRSNSYIPLVTIAHMGELGVFGLTLPEEHGGMGLGKESMCVVSEELSRGDIGVGPIRHPAGI